MGGPGDKNDPPDEPLGDPFNDMHAGSPETSEAFYLGLEAHLVSDEFLFQFQDLDLPSDEVLLAEIGDLSTQQAPTVPTTGADGDGEAETHQVEEAAETETHQAEEAAETETHQADEVAETERLQAEEAAETRRIEEEAAKNRAEIAEGKLPVSGGGRGGPGSPPPGGGGLHLPLVVPNSPESAKRALAVAAELLFKWDDPSIFEGLKGNRAFWERMQRELRGEVAGSNIDQHGAQREGSPMTSEEMEELADAKKRSRLDADIPLEDDDLAEAKRRSLIDVGEADSEDFELEEARIHSLHDQQHHLPDEAGPSHTRRSPESDTESSEAVRKAHEEQPESLLNMSRRQLAAEAPHITSNARSLRAGASSKAERNVLEEIKWDFLSCMWQEARDAHRKVLLISDLDFIQQLYERSMRQEPSHTRQTCDLTTEPGPCCWNYYFEQVLRTEGLRAQWRGWLDCYTRDLVRQILLHMDSEANPNIRSVKRYPKSVINIFELWIRQHQNNPLPTPTDLQSLSAETGVDPARIVGYIRERRFGRVTRPRGRARAHKGPEVPNGINEVPMAVQQELIKLAIGRRSSSMRISTEDAVRTAQKLGQAFSSQQVKDWMDTLRMRCKTVTKLKTAATKEIIEDAVNAAMQGLPTPAELEEYRRKFPQEEWQEGDLNDILNSNEQQRDDELLSEPEVQGEADPFPLELSDGGQEAFLGSSIPDQFPSQAMELDYYIDYSTPHNQHAEGEKQSKSMSEGGRKTKSASEGERKTKSASEVERKTKSASEGERKIKSASEGERKTKSASEGEGKTKSANEVERKTKSTNSGSKKPDEEGVTREAQDEEGTNREAQDEEVTSKETQDEEMCSKLNVRRKLFEDDATEPGNGRVGGQGSGNEGQGGGHFGNEDGDEAEGSGNERHDKEMADVMIIENQQTDMSISVANVTHDTQMPDATVSRNENQQTDMDLDQEGLSRSPGRRGGRRGRGRGRSRGQRQPNPSSPPSGDDMSSASSTGSSQSQNNSPGGIRSPIIREGWYNRLQNDILNDARAAVDRLSDTNEDSPDWPDPEQMKRVADEEDDQLNSLRWSFVFVMVGDRHLQIIPDTARAVTSNCQFVIDLYRNQMRNRPQHCRRDCDVTRDSLTCCWTSKFQKVNEAVDETAKAELTINLFQSSIVEAIYDALRQAPNWGKRQMDLTNTQVKRYPKFCHRILRQWVNEHGLYPKKTEKLELLRTTGMPLEGLDRWFKSRRAFPAVEGADGAGPAKQRARTGFTEEQRRVLTEFYTEHGPYPSRPQMDEMGERLQIARKPMMHFGVRFRLQHRDLWQNADAGGVLRGRGRRMRGGGRAAVPEPVLPRGGIRAGLARRGRGRPPNPQPPGP